MKWLVIGLVVVGGFIYVIFQDDDNPLSKKLVNAIIYPYADKSGFIDVDFD